MGFPWNWVSALGAKNYNEGAIEPRKKFDDIFSYLDTVQEHKRRTDRQMDTGRQQIPRIRMASRGNYNKKLSYR